MPTVDHELAAGQPVQRRCDHWSHEGPRDDGRRHVRSPNAERSLRAHPMSRLLWVRVGLAILATNQLLVGVWAIAAPASFFDDFPLGRGWVAQLPPYNEHLVRDVGGFSLGFAVLFVFATVKPHPVLLRPALLAWLATAIPHLIFHLGHLAGFGAADAVTQSAGLAIVVVIPVAVLVASGGTSAWSRHQSTMSSGPAGSHQAG